MVPALLVLIGSALAWAAISIDAAGASEPWSSLLVEASVESSRAVLTTVAGATASVAGIVFALTAVAVQLASSTYSPRVIQGYLRAGFQQAVIGVVAATFAFALLCLASIDDGGTAQPRVTVTLGVGLGVVSFLLIIAMIDHVVRSLRADSIIRRLTDETLAAIRRHHPDRVPGAHDDLELPESDAMEVRSDQSGWLRSIDRDGLLDRLPPGSMVRLDVPVGALLREDGPVATVWSDHLSAPEAETIVRDSLAIGHSRTLDQDPIFGFRLLSDVALRALSPGVNDPTTAVTVVRHLGALLIEVFTRDLPPRVHRDDSRRIYEPLRPTEADFLRVAVREIRLAATSQPEVLEALAGLFSEVASATDPESQRHDLLIAEAADLVTAASSLDEGNRRRVTDLLGDLWPG